MALIDEKTMKVEIKNNIYDRNNLDDTVNEERYILNEVGYVNGLNRNKKGVFSYNKVKLILSDNNYIDFFNEVVRDEIDENEDINRGFYVNVFHTEGYLVHVTDYKKVCNEDTVEDVLERSIKLDYTSELFNYEIMRNKSSYYFIFVTFTKDKRVNGDVNIWKKKYPNIMICNTLYGYPDEVDSRTIELDLDSVGYNDIFYEGIKSHIFASGLNVRKTEGFIVDVKYYKYLFNRKQFDEIIDDCIKINPSRHLGYYTMLKNESDKYIIFIRFIKEEDVLFEEDYENIDSDYLNDSLLGDNNHYDPEKNVWYEEVSDDEESFL